MDTQTRDLIDDLTTELERCEGAITQLFLTLDRLGLADEAVTAVVHARQAAILELVHKVRGDATRPGALPRGMVTRWSWEAG